jgi:mycothiol synthase
MHQIISYLEFLISQGFEKLYSPVAMNRSLLYFQMPDAVQQLITQREAEGFTFGTVQDGDLYALIQFANQAFNPDWGRAIREGLLQGLPTERILVAKKDDHIVGFCLYGGYEGIPERFGPFGVDPTYQGKGLGKILLYQCLRLMRREGLHGAWFLWTGEKTAAGHLYKKVDFQVTRQFHVLKKIL